MYDTLIPIYKKTIFRDKLEGENDMSFGLLFTAVCIVVLWRYCYDDIGCWLLLLHLVSGEE